MWLLKVLQNLVLKLNAKKVEIPGSSIKTVGNFKATVKLYEAQVAELNVSVVAQTVEGEAKAEPTKAKKETKEEAKVEEKTE